MGLCIPERPVRKKVPIAYSYNGTILPKLPEWDRSVYPYAVMFESGSLWVMDGKPYMKYSNTNAEYANYEVYTVENGTYILSNSGNNVNVNSEPIWSNTDIYYHDGVADVGGTLFLKASDPVPVYE